MGERMTSQADAQALWRLVTDCIDAAEAMGFSRGQTAAGMLGIACSQSVQHNGRRETYRLIDTIRSEVDHNREGPEA